MLAICFQLFLLVLCTGHLRGQGVSSMCQDKDDELAACSHRLQQSFSQGNRPSVETMCSEIEKYIKCEHRVGISCHDNPLIQEEEFSMALEGLKTQFNEHCPRNVTQVLCEYSALFEDFAPLCYPMVNSIQPDTSIEDLCSNARKYLGCILAANAPCTDSERNLNMGIQITRNGIGAQCTDEDSEEESQENWTEEDGEGLDETTRDATDTEGMQGDAPMAETTTADIPENQGSDCSPNSINAQIGICSGHMIQTFGIVKQTNKHYCRYSRRYLRCIHRLLKRCPVSSEQKEMIFDRYKEEMVNTCEVNSARCPFDVMEDVKNIFDYCKDQNEGHNLQLGSPQFCRYLEAMPRCLVRTKNRCKNRGFRSRDIRDVLIAVRSTLGTYCEDGVDERSVLTDLGELAMDERSDPIGESIYDAIDEGDEVGELQSVVTILVSLP